MTHTNTEAVSEKLDAETLERRLHLWFFRDLSDEQRLGLFKLCGYPVDEMPTHAIQQLSLRHLVSALSRRSARNTGGVEVDPKNLGATDAEKLCASRAMDQWRASIKRPDMSEEDRVRGVIEAYQRQAFALSSLAAEAEPVARPSYDAISTMVHACRERQKAAGEGDQMLSRWISEGLDGLYTRSSSVSAEVTEETLVAVARLYGNYIDGHGWTGFGPTPEQIEAAILSSINGGRENG